MALMAEFLNDYALSSILVALIVILLTTLYNDFADEFPYKGIPLIGKNPSEWTNKAAKMRFVTSARELMAQGFDQGKTVFQIMTSVRPMVVLHPRYMDEVKSHPDLSFEEAMRKAFFGGQYPGFEVFDTVDNENILIDVVKFKLTKSLGPLMIPLSRETAAALEDTFPYSKEWKPYVFAQRVPHMVARISSLVFLGETICRDQEWLDVAVNFAIDAFFAVRDFRMWPSFLRPLVHWFLPPIRRMRRRLGIARAIVQRELTRRQLIKEGKLVDQGRPKTHQDVLDWFQETAAGRPFDAALGQVALSLAAIHTTSHVLTNVTYDLAAYPEYTEALREEIRTVLKEDGVLRKSSLTKMKLMDSVLKETLRLYPTNIAGIHRLAMKDIKLSDGKIIPKGATTMVSGHIMTDESVYENAKEFNGRRFLHKRQEPGNEHRYQFVSTSAEHFGFGHGQHVCPGRFFAANELKIILIHMLIKYDWKFAEDRERPKSFEIGTEVTADPTVTLLFKSRKPDIDVSSLGE